MKFERLNFRYRDLRFFFLITVLISVISIAACNFNLLKPLELLISDYFFIMRGQIDYSPDIVFVDMDEKSINSIGRWPWSRDWHAALTSILTEYKTKAVLFDIFFSEESNPDDDQAFAEAMKKAGNVYIAVAWDFDRRKGIKKGFFNIPILANACRGTGYINFDPDFDGVIRRGPMITYYGGKQYYYISFQVAMDLLGIDGRNLVIEPNRIRGVKDGKTVLDMPVDDNFNTIVNWSGPWLNTFKHYSYIDIVRSYARIKEGKKPIVNLKGLENKIIIIGLTATGLWDIRPNPLEPLYPAVGIHANILNSILYGKFVREASLGWNIFLIILFGFFSMLIMLKNKFLQGTLFMLGLGLAYWLFAYFLFVRESFLINVSYTLFNIIVCHAVVNVYNEIVAKREMNRLMFLSTTDGLTGLNVIRHFNLLSEAFFKDAVKKRENLHIILLDGDNFKKVNDTYGHQAGDAVLREVAHAIKINCRKFDVPARYGGEEFVILCMHADKEGAMKLAERIRKTVESTPVKTGEHTLHVTISGGVSGIQETDSSKDDIIRRADAAMYESKQAGKNRITYK